MPNTVLGDASRLIPDLWSTCTAKIAREPEIWDQE